MDIVKINGSGFSHMKDLSKNEESRTNSVIKKSADLIEYLKERPEYIPSIQEKTIIHAIESANKKLQGEEREFEFSVHEKTKQIMVKVIDKQSKEVIREIPSEKILDLVAAMCEMAGLFVDEKR